MSKKARQMQTDADNESNPATQCECGTIRTPGQTHTQDDTGPVPKGTLTQWCNK